MSMIFDGFPSRDEAEEFTTAVAEEFGLEGLTFDSEQEAYDHDPFPSVLRPPIVHIARADLMRVENAVQERARQFGGTFAGT